MTTNVRATLNYVGSDGVEIPLQVDPYVDSFVTMDHAHRMIHRGLMFETFVYNAALGNGSNIDILFRTAAGQPAHLVINASLEDTGDVFLYEDPTTSADGSGLTEINRNRISANTADSAAFSGPTVTDPGTLLTRWTHPGNTGPFGRTPGSISTDGEFILAADTDYLVRLNNASGANIVAELGLLWYEPS